ncbi:TPA: DNA cytosine methyltransferase [Stenotrophomonas maltophilia]|nr:DNA cytosine methyltransferase [Stenotrophomonas maltophilia]
MIPCMTKKVPKINAIDLFCGLGGLSYGLKKAGVKVLAGFDIDETCRYAFEKNVKAPFHCKDIKQVTAAEIKRIFPKEGVRLLAGCAPCQPFSSYRRGSDTKQDIKWPLLDEFRRLVEAVKPDLVTMENVPGIGSTDVFVRFVDSLKSYGYHVSFQSCFGPRYGLAQRRRRLVLVGSRLGPIAAPEGSVQEEDFLSVRDVIGRLPKVQSGQVDKVDPLHKARTLSPINLARIQASIPGGTWRDWPKSLRAPCHLKDSGSSFQSVYARMSWDEPAPTITTQAFSFGTGRFGHPEQDRALTLRECAMLQGFPREYIFIEKGGAVEFLPLGRLIGNAVPPPLGAAIGRQFVGHIKSL